MRFLRDAVITILLLAVVVGIFIFATVRRGALAADEEPGRFERSIAAQLVRLSIPPEADRQSNPFGGTADAWQTARDHYQDHCAICHGRDGRGGTEIGKNMYPRVPDLSHAEVQNRSDGALFYIIQNGIRWTGMPAWKQEHSPDETWQLVAFLRKIPTLTDADLPNEQTSATSGESRSPRTEREPSAHEHGQK
jgi:mono/diheme cytochrome c family protein